MSVASEITRISGAKAALKTAIEAKGVTVPSATTIDGYAALVMSIPTGGYPNWMKDGDTHLWIDIQYEDQLDQQLRLRMIGTIDWGDGTTESINVTSYTTKTHTYAAVGKYRIDLKPSSGTFYLGGDSSSYNIMGTRSGRYRKVTALYQAEVGTKQINQLSAYSFYSCYGLQRVYIPATITAISSACFYYCVGLFLLDCPKGTVLSGANSFNSTFSGCYSLLDITNLKMSGVGATTMTSTFSSAVNITEITVPPTITTFGDQVLYHVYSLRFLRCLPTTPPSVTGTNVFASFPASAVIQVPFGSLSAYQAESGWSTYASQMVEAGAITMALTNVKSSNNAEMVEANSSYTTTLTADEGYTLGTVTVTMGGVDITSTAYSAGVISIASVTGNITITASATAV